MTRRGQGCRGWLPRLEAAIAASCVVSAHASSVRPGTLQPLTTTRRKAVLATRLVALMLAGSRAASATWSWDGFGLGLHGPKEAPADSESELPRVAEKLWEEERPYCP